MIHYLLNWKCVLFWLIRNAFRGHWKRATSKTRIRTPDPDPEKPGPWKTWDKYGIKNCLILESCINRVNKFFGIKSLNFKCQRSEAIVWMCSVKKVFIKILQNSQKNICTGIFRLEACNFIKKRLRHICFPENFVKVLRTPILQNAGWRLLLKYLLKFKIAAPDKLLVMMKKICKFFWKKKQLYGKKSTELKVHKTSVSSGYLWEYFKVKS